MTYLNDIQLLSEAEVTEINGGATLIISGIFKDIIWCCEILNSLH